MSVMVIKATGSTDGMPIKITQSATPGDTIHQAVAGTTPGVFDEIWIWAYNSHSSAVELTLEWGGASVPDQNIKVTLAAGSVGLVPIIPGLRLQNSKVVKAFASVANVVTLHTNVNAVTI